jgi:uncharacterized protein with PQ loop repeat
MFYTGENKLNKDTQMTFLDFIPATIFETIEIIAGLSACFVLFIQLYKEFKSDEKSSLSMVFVVGWIFIFFFWALYGIRFYALAIWMTNSIAFLLQIALLIVVRKRIEC